MHNVCKHYTEEYWLANIVKMYLHKSLIVLTCLFKLNYAELKSCMKEAEAPRICQKSNESYLNPFPLNLTTIILLKEIVDIDEDKKSITMQMNMFSLWKDSRIDSSNATNL